MNREQDLNLLILGSRKGLKTALNELSLAHTVCTDYKDFSKIEGGPFTHVLASGEGTMALANRARKELGLPFISERVISLCSDKLAMKLEASNHDIPVTPFLPGNTSLSSEEIYETLGPKVVVKEKNNSGGKGQKIYCSPQPISSSENDLIEGFISGREMSIESFIENGEIKFTSTTKYVEIGVINVVPSHEDSETLKRVLKINERVIKAFGIPFGLTHLEVYITDKGILFGEVALRPPGGHIMNLIDLAHDMKSWEAYVKLHIGEKLPEFASMGAHAGAIVYHPGKGVIEQIEGVEDLENLQTLHAYKIKGKIGEEVSPRDGVGKERAHFIFTSKDRELLLKEIGQTRQSFKMRLKDKA